MNTLRAELQELLGSVKCSRKPVLRRSREEEHLYTADGWIDGYTGKEQREIEFEIYDGGIIFTYTTDGVDDSAAERDPRWMPYEIWVQNRIAKRRDRQAKFLAAYL